MKKYLPTLLAIGSAALTAALPTLQTLVASNPKAAIAVSALAVVASSFAPSPLSPPRVDSE